MVGATIDLARGPSEVMLVTLEDLWLERAPQNVPGTYHERPNWLRPLAVDAVSLGIEPGAAGAAGAAIDAAAASAATPPARLDVLDEVARVRAMPPAPRS